MDQYLKIILPVSADFHEVLMAELSLLEYDSFQEDENGLFAFVLEDQYVEEVLRAVLEKYDLPVDFKVEKLENINWNQQWESNFNPVYVAEKVQIRADFHQPKPGIKYDVIINPKMSFGTGHHETTHLMVEEQLKIEHAGKDVLDAGTGTGILAIMSNKLGAESIVATDIDDWSIENCRENFKANQVQNVRILKGSIHNLTLSDKFDIIYANINKNVLMDELAIYAQLLAKSGIIVLSGFYLEDIEDLIQLATGHNLMVDKQKIRNNWALLRLSSANI